MIKLIGERMGLDATDAYMFSSLAVDMRVTQLVDGNKGIHAMLPKRVCGAGEGCIGRVASFEASAARSASG